jgi:major membrane immunogen (membrane-anchored lipoprotein)
MNKNALIISILATSVLTGCNSDDKDKAPTVSAASSVAIKENRTLSITANGVDDNNIVSYSWTQISGPILTLANATNATVQITAPAVSASAVAVLRVTVTDQKNQTASTDVNVGILNNILPTATVAFKSAAEKSAVSLTAAAADSDGAIKSYNWVQISGETVTLAGTNSSTLSFVAPSVVTESPLGFRLTVTDDDNETTTLDGVVSITPVLNTYTISGTVAETAFANANISAKLAGKVFTTKADAEGVFSLPLQADDDETNLLVDLKASSATTNGLEFYKFIPKVTLDTVAAAPVPNENGRGNATSVANAAADNPNNPNRVAVNAVSTALYSLIVDANGGKAPENLENFSFVEKSVSPDELIEAAAVVRLVAQGGTFALPQGVSNVLELLNNTQAYNNYVTAVETQTPGIITQTITAIIEDPVLTPQVDTNSFASAYYEVYPAGNGFLSRGGNKFSFAPDGTGTEVSSSGTREYNWALEDGKIVINYDSQDGSGISAFIAINVGSYGLTQEDIDLLRSYGYSTQLEVKDRTIKQTWVRVVKGEKIDSYRATVTGRRSLVPITLPNGVIIKGVDVDYTTTNDQLLRNADKLENIKFVAEEMQGQWLFEHYYYAGKQGTGYASMFADILDIKSDGTGLALETNLPFTWRLNDKGVFVFTFADGSYTEVIKLDQFNNDIQVFNTTYSADGKVVAADADYAFKLDNSDFSRFDQINTEQMYWQSMINTWNKRYWNNNILLWGDGISYFGWQFLANGSGYQLAYYEKEPPQFEPIFNAALRWQEAQISADKSIMNINRSQCRDDPTQACQQRQWQLLKTTEGVLGPRIYVYEIQKQRTRSTSDWVISRGLGPRLNIYEKIAFSYWNSNATPPPIGQNTLPPSFTPPATLFMNAPRKLMEPNKKEMTTH